jgi:hypothetical protein
VEIVMRVHHGVVVMERLALPHEDDVAHAHAGRALGTRLRLGDLARGQVALQPHLRGGAEGAAERAPRLRREAQGQGVAVAHEHDLDAPTVGHRAKEVLAGTVLGAARLARVEQRPEAEPPLQRPELGLPEAQVLPVGDAALVDRVHDPARQRRGRARGAQLAQGRGDGEVAQVGKHGCHRTTSKSIEARSASNAFVSAGVSTRSIRRR